MVNNGLIVTGWWLVVYLPLWKIWVMGLWRDDDINPIWWESHKCHVPMFQTTKQMGIWLQNGREMQKWWSSRLHWWLKMGLKDIFIMRKLMEIWIVIQLFYFSGWVELKHVGWTVAGPWHIQKGVYIYIYMYIYKTSNHSLQLNKQSLSRES